MIQNLLLSTRTAIQFAILYLYILAAGVQLGLNTTGPFSYLDTQLTILDAKRTILQDLAPLIETFPWVHDMVEMAIAVAMRGVTLGHNAPLWVSSEFVIAVVTYHGLAAVIVLLRGWKYTTTTHIN